MVSVLARVCRGLWLCLLVAGAGGAAAAPYDRAAEITQYLGLVQSDSVQSRRQAAADLAWVGLSDRRLFEPLADRLRRWQLAGSPAADTEEMLAYVAALGGSGLAEYRAVLQGLAAGKQAAVADAATAALAELDHSAAWNAIISDDARVSAQVPFPIALYLNMLESGDPGLVLRGAERVQAERLENEFVLRALERVLEQQYRDRDDEDWVAALGASCDALAYAGGPAYRKVLERVSRHAASKALRKRAAEAMRDWPAVR